MNDDLLMWVGASHWPTVYSFVEEAAKLGVCKRLPQLPPGVEPGKTRVFLAHDEGKKGRGRIFGFFTIERLEVIVENDEARERFYQDVKEVDEWRKLVGDEQLLARTLEETKPEPPRGCGKRKPGSYALAEGEDFETLWELAKDLPCKAEVYGPLITFERPLDYSKAVERTSARFRGYRRIDGVRLLNLAGQSSFTRARAFKGSRALRVAGRQVGLA